MVRHQFVFSQDRIAVTALMALGWTMMPPMGIDDLTTPTARRQLRGVSRCVGAFACRAEMLIQASRDRSVN